MERALHDMTSAFTDAGDRVDIWAPKDLGGTWAIDPARFHRIARWRVRGARYRGHPMMETLLHAAQPVRRRLSPRYDLYFGFRWGTSLADLVRADRRWISPSGSLLTPELLARHDAVAMQAPGNVELVPAGFPTVLLPPPLLPLADDSHRPPGLPDQYVLTVFNPYSPVKGAAEMHSLLATSPVPVVWCISDETMAVEAPEDLRGDPRLVVKHNLSRSELRHLYEHAYAYVSLSVSEGFGWAIADALRYSRRVVSRRVGVLGFDEALQPGVTLLDDAVGVAGLDWDALETAVAPEGGRDLDWLSADSFRARVEDLLGNSPCSGGDACWS
jgi:hypothetical protein